MSDTPRERVRTALAHRQPARVPFGWGFCATPEMGKQLEAYYAARGIDWPRLCDAVRDIRYIGPTFVGPADRNGNALWGIRQKAFSYGDGSYDEFDGYPLAGVETVAEIDAYPWPDPDWFDNSGMVANLLAEDPERRCARNLVGGSPFEIYCWMTGLEEGLINAVANPEVVTAALEHIVGFYAEKLRRSLAAAGDYVDIVFLADDLGGQHGLLMSRETYRAVIQPFHARLAALVHEMAPHAYVMFHSDGAVFDVLPDVIDAGIDVLEAVQTDADGMEPERLKAAFGDRLSFHGAISVQQLLPHCDAATVAEECRRLVRVLGEGGGYIAAPAHAIQVGTPPENVDAMLRAILGADYDSALTQAQRSEP
jgi:uroporphyrinogen decarboxylase